MGAISSGAITFSPSMRRATGDAPTVVCWLDGVAAGAFDFLLLACSSPDNRLQNGFGSPSPAFQPGFSFFSVLELGSSDAQHTQMPHVVLLLYKTSEGFELFLRARASLH